MRVCVCVYVCVNTGKYIYTSIQFKTKYKYLEVFFFVLDQRKFSFGQNREFSLIIIMLLLIKKYGMWHNLFDAAILEDPHRLACLGVVGLI